MLRKIIQVFESRTTVVLEAGASNHVEAPPPRPSLPKKDIAPNPHHTAKLALHRACHQVFGQFTEAKLESVGTDPKGKTVGYFTAYVKHPFDGQIYRHCWRYGIIGDFEWQQQVVLEHTFPCSART